VLIWWLIRRSGSARSAAPVIPRPKLLSGSAAVYSIQGLRAHMEDAFVCDENLPHGRALYGVFDGHGGSKCAEFCAARLPGILRDTPPHADGLAADLRQAFLALDQQWLRLASECDRDDGSTAVVALLAGSQLAVAHVGDSKAGVSTREGALELTRDHKPNRSDERQRIEALGGRVLSIMGTWRVEGVLAVSRAIGDRRLKKFVSALPEVAQVFLTDEHTHLLLASDGVWDVLTMPEAADVLTQSSDLCSAARAIGDAAFARGSGDNITALVVDLKKFASAGVSDPSAPEPPSSPSRGLHGASARKKEKLK